MLRRFTKYSIVPLSSKVRLDLGRFEAEFARRGLFTAQQADGLVGTATSTPSTASTSTPYALRGARAEVEAKRADDVDQKLLPFLKPLQRRKFRAALKDAIAELEKSGSLPTTPLESSSSSSLSLPLSLPLSVEPVPASSWHCRCRRRPRPG